MEYLAAAFLLRRMGRIDQNARHFKKVTSFKVYLTNPSMRSALFGHVKPDNDMVIGHPDRDGDIQSVVAQQRDRSSLLLPMERGRSISFIWRPTTSALSG